MSKKLNKSILAKILEIIPENIKPVNLFMDILDLGKESAYRRLRGEKALSLEEIHKLSSELDFSLDEILDNKRTNTFDFNYIGFSGDSPENNILEFLLSYEKSLTLMLNAEKTEVTCTMNHFFNTMLVGFEELFKFTYYRWMHQMKEVPLNYLFANVIIPPDIKNVCNRIHHLQQQIQKVTLIIDKSMYLNLIKEMQYFYVRELLSESELIWLKKQCIHYMDYTEKIVKKGSNNKGNVFEIYLSMLNISCNTSYTVWDDNAESGFWYNLSYPMLTQNKKILDGHKHWIDSLKKYSTLITQSNELLQADYFNEQRGYIKNISDNILL